MSARKKRVVPFVEDYKNVLIFTPEASLDQEEMASLQAALKEAIQKHYQLEPTELSTVPLPDYDLRKSILVYESSEGGAGVLRQLVDDPTAPNKIASDVPFDIARQVGERSVTVNNYINGSGSPKAVAAEIERRTLGATAQTLSPGAQAPLVR